MVSGLDAFQTQATLLESVPSSEGEDTTLVDRCGGGGSGRITSRRFGAKHLFPLPFGY